VLDGHFGRANVLRDEPSFTLNDGGAPDAVEQGGLAVVDVTKNADDGLPGSHDDAIKDSLLEFTDNFYGSSWVVEK
jgi:hypothetical protein